VPLRELKKLAAASSSRRSAKADWKEEENEINYKPGFLMASSESSLLVKVSLPFHCAMYPFAFFSTFCATAACRRPTV
jgi:hypothetical protein